ncbi:flavodoxin domain-containing protein [Zongyangia hominis]|uniref:Flavodoxin domain-containing protein n=1 Tax=Zongyangia hominis TaxID=2763677 RepID=A0A926EDC4_9FIRM|nr:flavodoxin domain-containing protein [Zongyangia hominis]MBC8570334.1 hypothetical protein [Zongyangia hominis]
MMNTAVIYASMTGKTKKVANAMAEALGTRALPAKEAGQVEADLLLLGSGVYGGNLSPDIEAFARSLDPGRCKKAALFTTSVTGAAASGPLRQILEEKGIPVLEEEFSCLGRFLLVCRMGHPNSEELSAAAAFAKACAASLSDGEA